MTILLTARLREAARWKTFEPGDMVEAAERIERLEAALREIRDKYPPGEFRDLEDECAIWHLANDALGLAAETEGKRPEHATARSVTQAQTPRSDINIPCSCGPGDCNRRILAHNEYCTDDRRAWEVEEDLALDRRVYGTSFHRIVDGKKVRVHPQDIRYIKGEPRDSSNTACSSAKHEITAKPGEKP